MDVWGALQYVGTGLSLVAFVVAAALLAYRARLQHRAEIIRSAPEKERLEAIAVTAEFFRVDVSRLSREQQEDIVLVQIHARARRDLLFAAVTLIVAILLAIVAIVLSKSGPIIGLDETGVRKEVTEAQKPLNDRLESLAAQVARDKGVEVPPLRAILVKLGDAGVRDEDIAKRLDERADELIKLREGIAKLRQGAPELASFAQKAQVLIEKGDLEGAHATLAAGAKAAHTEREQSTRDEAGFLPK